MFVTQSLLKTPGVGIRGSIVSGERYRWVDFARGLAILFVVYRHVVVGMMRADFQVPAAAFRFQELFYNFRMPLFFLLSGVFVAKSEQNKSFKTIIRNRAGTLLYPYLLWGCILITLQIIFSRFTNASRGLSDYLYLVTQPRKVDHLWYLLALFNTSLIYLLLNQVIKNKWFHIAFAAFLHALSITTIFEGNSFAADICYFYLYFVCGTWFSGLLLARSSVLQLTTITARIILVMVFIIGQWFWYTHADEDDMFLPLFIVINLLGCWTMYLFSNYISQFPSSQWLAFIGERSLYIYILHVPIAALFRSFLTHIGLPLPSIIILLICWAAGVLLPVGLYQLLRNHGFSKLFSLTKSRSA